MITVQGAIEKIKGLAKGFGVEDIILEEAFGRVLAEEVHSDRDYPPFNRATMDGIAIRADDFLVKNIREFQIVENVFAGSEYQGKIPSGYCVRIMTGAPVPSDANAVIRIEDTKVSENKILVTSDTIKSFQNIAFQGEDIKQRELILKEGTIITPAEISLLAVVGKAKVKVFKNPSVAIISTGNEIKSVEEIISPYQIRDSNSYAIMAFFKKHSIPVSLKKVVKDNKEELILALKEALDHEIVITSGGVSMGEADFLPDVFHTLGVEKVFHKVQVKPGKPLWVGKTGSSVVFGLPGNPVSVQVACKIFIEPFLKTAFKSKDLLSIRLPMAELRKKRTKFDEFFPCTIERKGNASAIKPVIFNGSGDITATIASNGIALHPAGTEDLHEDDFVEFFQW